MPSAQASSVRFTAVFFRAYASVLAREGRLPAMREKASPALRKLIDRMPLPTSWLDGAIFEEMFAFVRDGKDDLEPVRALCHQGTREQTGNVLMPIFKSTLALFGPSPASIFSQLTVIGPIVVRGFRFGWTATGPDSGIVQINSPDPFDASIYASWEGGLRFIFELCDTVGETFPAEISDGGRQARIPTKWKSKR